jgi:hypothetical protein
MFEWKKWGNASFLHDLSTVAYEVYLAIDNKMQIIKISWYSSLNLQDFNRKFEFFFFF